MMLVKDLYEHELVSFEKNDIKSKIILNKESNIYKGHFPEISITPGVCQVLIVKEILSAVLNKKIVLTKSRDIKFLSMHNPQKAEFLDVNIKFQYVAEDKISVVSSIFFNDIIYLKFNGEFTAV